MKLGFRRAIIGADNGLAPDRHQNIIWINADPSTINLVYVTPNELITYQRLHAPSRKTSYH